MVWFIEVDGLPVEARSLSRSTWKQWHSGTATFLTSWLSARMAPLPSCSSDAERNRISHMAATPGDEK